MKRIVWFIVCVVATLPIWAVMATPDPIVRVLSNGQTDTVLLHGDEYCHWMSTLRGQEIPFSRTEDAALLAQKPLIRRSPEALMLNYYVPRSGEVHIPVVLVNYKDLSFTMPTPQQRFYEFFNTNGGTNPHATGSVHTYYYESSMGQLRLIYDVYGPYTVSREQEYYGTNSGSSHNKRAGELVVEAACLMRDNNPNLNWNIYDNNKDGKIDNISIITAGYNEAEGGPEKSIWPHYSTVNSAQKFSGNSLCGYLIISEYRGSGGSIQAGIGTYCHEFGHALGLPDLYHTTQSDTYTVGKWDLMASGSYNNNGSTPPTFSGFERFAMGWLTPVQLSESENIILPPIETSNQVYMVATEQHNMVFMNPKPNEYFLIENRQKSGWDRYEGALVGTGLMVSHITFVSSYWDNNTFNNHDILGYGIVSAGITRPTSSTPADLFPGTYGITEWLPTQNDGTQLSEQKLINIRQQADTTMAFHYGPIGEEGFLFNPESLPVLTTTFEMGPVDYDLGYVMVTAKHILDDTIRISTSNELFQFSIDGGNTWRDYAHPYSIPTDTTSIVEIPVVVRHSPMRRNCSVKNGYLILSNHNAHISNQLALSGLAPRPIYIAEPDTLPATDITTTSFTTNWEGQDDAEYYYTSLYSVIDSPSVEVQDFKFFTTIEAIEAQGWQANFARINTTVSKTGASIYFTQSQQQLISKAYIHHATQLSFWISNNYVQNSSPLTGGRLLIEAAMEDWEDWEAIDSIRIQTTSKNLTKTFELSKPYTYIRLTYTHLGGDGGACIDAWQVSGNKKVNYVGKDEELAAPTTSRIYTNLQSSTIYYFSVKAYENKGCTPNLTARSALQPIRTLTPSSGKAYIRILISEDGQITAILPESADGSSHLNIYTVDGKMVTSISLPYGITRIEIPKQYFQEGHIYMLKQMGNEMKRRDVYGKFVYNPRKSKL